MITLHTFLIGAARVAAVAFAAAAPIIAPAPAAADDFSQRVNESYRQIAADRRSETVLIPLLAKMQPYPAGLEAGGEMFAALTPASSTQWSKLSEWAMAQPQRDLIEAVKKVTSEEDPRKAWEFGQPYGSDAADPDHVIAKLYTELGDPPTLAGAQFLYLPAMSKLFSLLHIEATRLAAEGKTNDAMDIVVRAIMLGRQMAHREFLKEKIEGMGQMYLAIMRLRDIAYLDSRLPAPKLTAENMRDLLRRIADNRATLVIDRIRLPLGDRVAGEQLIARVFTPTGPDAALFSSALAKIAAQERPLRLFSESAKWEALRPLQANAATTQTELSNVFNDWNKRWNLEDRFDPILKLRTDYEKMDKTRFATLDLILGDFRALFNLRRAIETEVVGTRTSLAMYGLYLQHRTLPRDVTAVRPTFTTRIDLDPWDQRKINNLDFFVPMRDRPGVGGAPAQPHEIDVFPDLPRIGGVRWPSFQVRLRDDTFVIYSAGPDSAKTGMRKHTGMIEDEKGDYLMWPPIISLLRQNLVETGNLK